VLRRALLLGFVACAGPDTPEPLAPEPTATAAAELVGTRARDFKNLTWLDDQPRTLADLRGQVVLVRFWTDTCPYCRRTAPRLRALDEELRARGLTVVGVYHPKPRGRPVPLADVTAFIKELALAFPIALDESWSTLDAWWLSTGDREATSASFLIDRRGVIRLVHPGPEYSDAKYADLRAAILALLAEPA